MSTAIEVYTGKDCSIQLDSGAIGNWTKYTAEVTIEKRAAKPARSKVYKQATIHKHLKLTLEGFRGGTETFADLAKPDTPCTPVFTDPPADFADYSDFRILDCNMSQDDGPGTYTMTIEQGNVGTSTASAGASTSAS